MAKVKSLFKDIGDRVNAIEKMAEIAEDQHIEAQYKLELIGEDRPITERILQDKVLPGDKIREMMDKWG